MRSSLTIRPMSISRISCQRKAQQIRPNRSLCTSFVMSRPEGYNRIVSTPISTGSSRGPGAMESIFRAGLMWARRLLSLFGIDAGFHLLTAGCAFWLWVGNILHFCASGECEWNGLEMEMYVLGPGG